MEGGNGIPLGEGNKWQGKFKQNKPPTQELAKVGRTIAHFAAKFKSWALLSQYSCPTYGITFNSGQSSSQPLSLILCRKSSGLG